MLGGQNARPGEHFLRAASPACFHLPATLSQTSETIALRLILTPFLRPCPPLLKAPPAPKHPCAPRLLPSAPLYPPPPLPPCLSLLRAPAASTPLPFDSPFHPPPLPIYYRPPTPAPAPTFSDLNDILDPAMFTSLQEIDADSVAKVCVGRDKVVKFSVSLTGRSGSGG